MTDATDPAAMLSAPGGPFEIVVDDMRGIPTQMYKVRMANLRVMVENAKMFPADKVALVQGDTHLTYPEFIARVASLAQSLTDLGVGFGDRVAIISANCPDWVVTFWATLTIGAVSVPLNAWWRTDELDFVLRDCGAKVAVVDERRHDTIRDLPASLPDLTHVLEIGTPEFDDLATKHADAPLSDVAIDEDDYACILYTSGTTGKPKGSIQSHRGVIANYMNLANRTMALMFAAASAPKDPDAPAATPTDQTAWLLIVPLFHVTGLFTTAVPAMGIAGKIAFMPVGRFEPTEAMRLIQDEQVTILSGVPTIMQRILDAPNIDDFDLSTLKQVSYGGSPSSTELQRRLAARFAWLDGGGPTTAYGLTESAAVITVNSGDDYNRYPDSCGRPVPTVDVRILGPDGAEVPIGERGEICAKGPIISPGYWNRPDATEETFVDGWLHTGDIGRVNDEGFVFILDRAKDMIIRGGENIYCAEVEDIIGRYAGVAEVAVIGVAHPDLGEEVKAVVVPVDGTDIDAADLERHASENLAHYKVPTIWEIRTELLPRNPSGKILKSALRGDQTAFATDGAPSDSAL